MSTKVKLVSLISAFVLVLAIMMVAVMAVPTVTLNMGGSISFTATDLQVTISRGVLANGTIEDSANKMQEVKIDAYDDGAEELATWTNLNLTFNESGEDMTITFTITNNSTVDDIRATVTVNQGTTNNATVSVTTPSSSNAIIPANDGSQQFVITFHVNNRNDSASIENFEINIDLEKYEPQVYDYFDFEVNSGGTTVTLTSFDEDLADTTDIVIPATASLIDGVWMEGDTYTVTDILSATSSSNGVFYNSGITSIEFPSTLKAIGNYAFYGCRGFTGELIIPEGVTSIGYNAFYSCRGIISIILPSSLTSIGNGAFGSYYGPETLEYKGTLEQWLSINFPVSWMGDTSHTFIVKGEELTDLVIPEGVTSIGKSTFYGCSGLTSITFPSSLTSIGSYAFDACSGLESIDFSNCTSLTSIRSYAFDECSGLTSITFPSSLTSIDGSAFSRCTGLETIEVEEGNSVYHSEENCLIETTTNTLILGLKNIVIPNYITSIGDYAFYNCDGLTSITFPSGLTSIGEDAFFQCSGLTSITLPSSLEAIGDSAFNNCSGLTSVTINQYVFENVTSSSSSCGYLLDNIGSGETVLVPANLIDDLGLTNSYLNGSSFTRSETAVDGYYVYTKI